MWLVPSKFWDGLPANQPGSWEFVTVASQLEENGRDATNIMGSQKWRKDGMVYEWHIRMGLLY